MQVSALPLGSETWEHPVLILKLPVIIRVVYVKYNKFLVATSDLVSNLLDKARATSFRWLPYTLAVY